jgi:AcrR family transcriptional regulator
MTVPATAKKRGRPSEGAREAVMQAALELFMERDFDEVSTADILERAGVSRGALYHHFPSKRELYRQVWLQLCEAPLVSQFVEAAAGLTPFEALLSGMRTYLSEAAGNRVLQRIGLLQSRTVLGWEGWRDGIRDLALGTMNAVVEAAMEAGEMRRGDVEATSHMMMAAIIEAGLLVATAEDKTAARKAAEPQLTALIEGLRR